MTERVKNILDRYLSRYNREEFIQFDPVQIPHMLTRKEDMEIAGFLAATIAWGQRKTIISNSKRLLSLMDNSPLEFLQNHVPDYRGLTDSTELFSLSDSPEWQAFRGFCHRTFNSEDCLFFLLSLKRIYAELGGLEGIFTEGFGQDGTAFTAIRHFREKFLELPHAHRVEKHVPNVERGSAAKRINMFLRWMVRHDDFSVDLGLWSGISPSALMLPLDVHSGNISRELGLLTSPKNDWAAVEEVTARLREFDPQDPIKYDFALFGAGVFKGQEM